MDLKTKRTICLVVGIASILTIVSTISYAYFTTMGDMKPVESVINTATVSARFADYGDEVGEELSFGESITKRFTIENIGSAEAHVKMYWVDLINTYIEGSLSYTLSYSENESGAYIEVVNKTNVPKSNVASKRTLAESLSIPVGKTYYYNLVITLNYLDDVNQDADLNAIFNSKFGIEDINEKYFVTFNANGGETGVINKTIIENEAYGTLPRPTRNNYEFLGWYTELENGIQITENSIVNSNENHTLFAHWRRLPLSEIITKASKGVRTSFDEPATTDEGVFEMEDNYGTSYYFRGAVENNYVRFAGYYWRIIRLNGDGSLRIIYDGTTAHTNGEASGDRFTKVSQPFNVLDDDAKYIGWMYGPANTVIGTTTPSTSKEEAQSNIVNSDIKTVVDEWYKTNIQDKGYGQYVSDTLFCNDRTTPGKEATGWSNDTGLGYGKRATAYGAVSRVRQFKTNVDLYSNPRFICPSKNDAFTLSDTLVGNGALTYPVGLITADEIVAAGSGKYITSNTNYYLYKSNSYYQWSLSPYLFNGSIASVFTVHNSGHFNYTVVHDTFGAIAPVINLSAKYVSTLKGTGTMTDPYTS